MAYQQYFLPSITYGMVTVSFTDQQIEHLHKQLYPKLLQKLGYRASLPRAIACAPKSLGGVGLVDFNVTILQHKTRLIVRHLRAGTEIGKIFLIMLRWAQVQSGMKESILTANTIPLYIESPWLRRLYESIQQIKAKLWIQENWELQDQRTNDVFLMEFFI